MNNTLLSNIETEFIAFGHEIGYFIEQFDSVNSEYDLSLKTAIVGQRNYNAWHTPESIKLSLKLLHKTLTKDNIRKISQSFSITDNVCKTISIRGLDHWPLSRFQYLIAVILSGNKCLIDDEQCSDKVFNAMCNRLILSNSSIGEFIIIGNNRINNPDAYIVEKDNIEAENTDDYLIKRHAHIVYKQSSVAILDGSESEDELDSLNTLIYGFFGMTHMSIKKIYVPENYTFNQLLKNSEKHYEIINHNKYANNYQYHQSVYLMNRIEHLDNGFLLLTQNQKTIAPTGVLYFDNYKDIAQTYNLHRENKTIYTIYSTAKELQECNAYQTFDEKLFFPHRSLIDFINKLK